MFTDADIISCYTWDDAVNDGTFIDVSHIAKRYGYTTPVAITSTLFHDHLKDESDDITKVNIQTLLMGLASYIKAVRPESSQITYPATFEDDSVTQLWATIEARSPSNPSPIMTIMLPSDY